MKAVAMAIERMLLNREKEMKLKGARQPGYRDGQAPAPGWRAATWDLEAIVELRFPFLGSSGSSCCYCRRNHDAPKRGEATSRLVAIVSHDRLEAHMFAFAPTEKYITFSPFCL